MTDIDDTPPSETDAPVVERKVGFAGLTRVQMVSGALIFATAIWGMWVTKTLVTSNENRIVSASLSLIIGEYVQAQARSATPPEKVEAEMRKFMSAVDEEMDRRASKGQIVIVDEAVLTKNVPDITQSVKKAVYASGIAFPKQASATQMEAMQSGMGAGPRGTAMPVAGPSQGQMTSDDAALAGGSPFAAAVDPSSYGAADGAGLQ